MVPILQLGLNTLPTGVCWLCSGPFAKGIPFQGLIDLYLSGFPDLIFPTAHQLQNCSPNKFKTNILECGFSWH